MIALGFLLAGVSRLMGVSGGGQVLVAAVLALVAVIGVRTVKRILRHRRGGEKAAASLSLAATPSAEDRDGRIDRRSQSDPAANMDVGAAVWVAQWDNGRARVRYRGAQWDAVIRDGVAAVPGWYHIHQIDGIRLILGS
jgi:membrane protein implicated in regulation of membrane protease activity